jgi:hypothetical protein
MLMPVTLASGRLRLATRPVLTGSAAVMKTIGMVEVAGLGGLAGIAAAGGDDQGDLAVHQFRGEAWQSIVLAFGPAIFDRQILAVDVSGFLQALPGRIYQIDLVIRRSAAEKSNHRHRLLRARDDW